MFPCLSITDLTYITLQGIQLIEHLSARRNCTYEQRGRILRTHVPLTAEPEVVGRRPSSFRQRMLAGRLEGMCVSPSFPHLPLSS